MVAQYPHTLNGTITGNATKNEATGDWVQGAQTSFTQKCRAEEKAGGYVQGVDGVRIDYSWVLYMPKDVPEVQVGTTVTVSNSQGIFLKDTVKGFFRHQLNAEVWL